MAGVLFVFALLLFACESKANKAPIDGDADGDSSDPCASVDCSPGTCAIVNGNACCDCPDGYTRYGLTKCQLLAPDGDPETDLDSEVSEALDGDLDFDPEAEISETPDGDESESELSEEEQCLTCFHDTGILCNPEPEVGQAAIIVDRQTEIKNTPITSLFLMADSLYYRSFNEAVSPSRTELRTCDRTTRHIWAAYDPAIHISDAYRDDEFAFLMIWNEAVSRHSISLCIQDTRVCESIFPSFRAGSTSCYRHPYFTFADDSKSQRLTVYSIPDKTTRVLQGLSSSGSGIFHDGKNLTLVAFPDAIEPYNSDRYVQPRTLWRVNLQDLSYSPVGSSMLGMGSTSSEGRYVVYVDQRDSGATGSIRSSNCGVYLFDAKYKRERPLTDNPAQNDLRANLEYPYVAFQYQEGDDIGTGGGFLEALNVESGESWTYDATYNDDSFSLHILQQRMLTSYTTGNQIVLFKLPPAASPPPTDPCVRRNPCVDDYWSSALQACAERPNHDRCDDGNAATPLDVCVAGECKGLALGADDAPMVAIPAGDFSYGSDTWSWEGPRRLAHLPSFSIDEHEVTNAQYKRCVAAGACAAPVRMRSGKIQDYYENVTYNDFPVLYVDWFEARNYCNWVGKRLPTEEEWVKAARGSADARDYPWGNEIVSGDANFKPGFTSFASDAAQVESYPKDVSPYGVYDMGGNVSEWTASAFSQASLDGPADWGLDLVVVKGSAWRYGPGDYVNTSPRIDVRAFMTPWSPTPYTGFRCAE